MQHTSVPSRPHPSSDKPRTDRPRTNGDPAEVARKLTLLDDPRVKPLSDFVRDLRAERGGDESIPWFDPTEAGSGARMLMLLEAPGRKATPGQGSGFVSPDNNDGSAENMWNLLREAGVNRRREIVTWNVIPWYIGSDSRVRGARAEDIHEAHEALVRLVRLLPDVRVVVLLGKAAADAWELAGVDLPAVFAPHPSPKNLNSRPQSREVILQALRDARERAGYGNTEGSPPPIVTAREVIRNALRAGLTPDQIFARNGRRRGTYLAAIEEEARLEGEFDTFAPTPENVVRLRDRRQLRWERIAVRVLGDPRRMAAVRDLYDAAKRRRSVETLLHRPRSPVSRHGVEPGAARSTMLSSASARRAARAPLHERSSLTRG